MQEKLQRILSLLELERSTIFEQLIPYPDEVLHQQPTLDHWSAIQVLHHLAQSERSSLLYVKKKLKAGDAIPDRRPLTKVRSEALNWSMAYPFKIKAPKTLKPPENTYSLAEMKRIWNAIRKDLTKFLLEYPEQYSTKAIYKHPIFGRVTLDQMLMFFRAHQARHHRQINRILKAIKD